MISDVAICNQALDILGVDPITSLDDDTKAARLMLRSYESERDATIRAYPWNFATKRAALALLSTAPAWGFANQYALPEGPDPAYCLRALYVEGELDGNSSPWKIEGRAWLTDAGPPLNVLYLARITDPTLFDPLFVQALAARLAAKFAYALTESATLPERIRGHYRDLLIEARRIDAQEGTADLFEIFGWNEARG